MLKLKTALSAAATTFLLGTGALVATVAPASAYMACNRDGDCWHTDSRPRAPGIKFDVHPDDWYFHQHWDADHHWRDYHDGRGYYRNGLWIALP